MTTRLRSLNLNDVSTWGHVYAVRGDSSLYLLDLRDEALMMRLPGFDCRDRRGDRNWLPLEGLYSCDGSGNPRTNLTVRVGDHHYWGCYGNHGLIQTRCASIERLNSRELRCLLAARTLSDSRRAPRAEGGKSGPAKDGKFKCSTCSARVPSSQAVHKRNGQKVCRSCATGQTCPKCRGHKNAAFDLCRECAGMGQNTDLHVILAGGFETNRRRH